MHTKALPYVGLLSLFWGTNVVVSRFGISEFDPFVFSALRLAIATSVFALIYRWQRRPWPANSHLRRNAALSGIIGIALPMTLFVLSLQYQSSGVTSIFMSTAPAIMVVAAHFFLPDEPLTTTKSAGVMLALSGSLFLALRGESGLADVGRASPWGFAFVFLGVCSEVTNAIFIRRHMQDMDPFPVTGIRLFTGALITGLLALWIGDMDWRVVTGAGYTSLIYTALVGALGGQFMAFYVTRRFGATAFSLTAYLIPVVATIFGVLLLGEIVTWGMIVGVILIGGGIYLVNWEPQAMAA